MSVYTKLSEMTLCILQVLYIIGYRWLAKDRHGVLRAYKIRPDKLSGCWYSPYDELFIPKGENTQEVYGLCDWKDIVPVGIKRVLEMNGAQVINGKGYSKMTAEDLRVIMEDENLSVRRLSRTIGYSREYIKRVLSGAIPIRIHFEQALLDLLAGGRRHVVIKHGRGKSDD